jgi:hypothetical protein
MSAPNNGVQSRGVMKKRINWARLMFSLYLGAGLTFIVYVLLPYRWNGIQNVLLKMTLPFIVWISFAMLVYVTASDGRE